jgi:hypothetical protein
MFYLITLNDTHTVGRTPLDEESGSRRDLYLTTLTRNTQPCYRRDSNPRSQQASGCRPAPETAKPKSLNFSCISAGTWKNLFDIPIRLKAGKSRSLPSKEGGVALLQTFQTKCGANWTSYWTVIGVDFAEVMRNEVILECNWECREAVLTSKFIFKLIIQDLEVFIQIMTHRTHRATWKPRTG